MTSAAPSSHNRAGAGRLLHEWRERRRRSQLDLALAADVSTRHLSYLENGRAQPSREMLLNLADELEIPLRERNVLLHRCTRPRGSARRDCTFARGS
ncbi:MAG: helix-turn-helix transcriptional regulator [Candidatus Velthaea sp.]